MARSQKQIQNSAKIIVVAAVSKEFRKSAIIEKILGIARKNNHVAKGELVSPKKSGSLKPYADDRWLVESNAIRVEVGPLEGGVPSYMTIYTSIPDEAEEVLDGKYFYLSQESPNKKWFPSVDAIKLWVARKAARGQKFTYMGKPARPSNYGGIAYLISRKIKERGIKKTNLTNPLKYKRTGVKATTDRGVEAAKVRLAELYGTLVIESIDETMNNIL